MCHFHAVGMSIGFTGVDIRNSLLHASGNMYILTEKVDSYTILLVGRWQSNNIIWCLHKKAKSFTEVLEIRILQHIYYMLIPTAHVSH